MVEIDEIEQASNVLSESHKRFILLVQRRIQAILRKSPETRITVEQAKTLLHSLTVAGYSSIHMAALHRFAKTRTPPARTKKKNNRGRPKEHVGGTSIALLAFWADEEQRLSETKITRKEAIRRVLQKAYKRANKSLTSAESKLVALGQQDKLFRRGKR